MQMTSIEGTTLREEGNSRWSHQKDGGPIQEAGGPIAKGAGGITQDDDRE